MSCSIFCLNSLDLIILYSCFFFFFFQAEDGIRDWSVTGVQTCALPILTVRRADGSVLGELPSVAEDPPFTPQTEFVKVGDGEGFYAVVIRPGNFDAAKRDRKSVV